MTAQRELQNPIQNVRMFWWAFAMRGGLAIVFGIILFLASSFLGLFIFDPVSLVYMSLLLGSYVLGNGLLLGVGAVFAREHRLHLWWLSLAESVFALLLGVYIGVSSMVTAQSLALLAGIYALVTGCFQAALAYKLRKGHQNWVRIGIAGVISVAVGVLFLAHIHQAARTTTQLLSGYQMFYGITWIGFAFRLRK